LFELLAYPLLQIHTLSEYASKIASPPISHLEGLSVSALLTKEFAFDAGASVKKNMLKYLTRICFFGKKKLID
jgi:hypothetical protein